MSKSKYRFNIWIKAISLFLLITFGVPEATQRHLSFLAPKTAVPKTIQTPDSPPFVLKLKTKQRLHLTPQAIFRFLTIQANSHYELNRRNGNLLLEGLDKVVVENSEDFFRLLTPFQFFLEEHLDSYYFASAFGLVLKTAPDEACHEKALNLLIKHVPQIQTKRVLNGPGRKKSFWIDTVTYGLETINEEKRVLSDETADALEEFLATIEVSQFEGIVSFSMRDKILHYFLNHLWQVRTDRLRVRMLPLVLREFEKNPTGAHIHLMLHPIFKDEQILAKTGMNRKDLDILIKRYVNDTFIKRIFKANLNLRALLSNSQASKKEQDQDQNNNATPPEETELSEEEKTRIEWLERFYQAKEALKKHFLTMLSNMKTVRNGRTHSLYRRFIPSTESDEIQHHEISLTYDDGPIKGSLFHLNNQNKLTHENEMALAITPGSDKTRTLGISFGYLHSKGPTPIVFETTTSSGAYITEEIFIHSDTHLVFESNYRRGAVTFNLPANGENILYTEGKVLHLNLAKLAELLGKQSRILASFYAPLSPKKKPRKGRFGAKPKIKKKPSVTKTKKSNGVRLNSMAWPLLFPLFLAEGNMMNFKFIYDLIDWTHNLWPYTHPSLIGIGLIAAIGVTKASRREKGWKDFLISSGAGIFTFLFVTFSIPILIFSTSTALIVGASFIVYKIYTFSRSQLSNGWLTVKISILLFIYSYRTNVMVSPRSLNSFSTYTSLLEYLFRQTLWKKKTKSFETSFSSFQRLPLNKQGDFNNYTFNFKEALNALSKEEVNPDEVLYYLNPAIKSFRVLNKLSFYQKLAELKEFEEQEEDILDEVDYAAAYLQLKDQEEIMAQAKEYGLRRKKVEQQHRYLSIKTKEQLAQLYIIKSYSLAKKSNFKESKRFLKRGMVQLELINQIISADASGQLDKISKDLEEDYFWRTTVPKYLSTVQDRFLISNIPLESEIFPTSAVEASL